MEQNLHFTKSKIKFETTENVLMAFLNEEDIDKIRIIASSVYPGKENVHMKLKLSKDPTNDDHSQFDLYVIFNGHLDDHEISYHIKDLQLNHINTH